MNTNGACDEYGSIADLYDHVVPYRERDDIRFFVEAATEAGGPVLEIGCGTGRVLIPCARAGVEMVGLDLSAGMLAVCEARLRGESAEVRRRVRLVQGDMRDFDLARTFALVTIPFRPFQHLLTVEDQLACLATARRHLADGGRLILDLFNPSLDALTTPAGQETGDEPQFRTPDGRQVTRRVRIAAHDRFSQVQQIELIHYVTHPGGGRERLVHAFAMRYLFRFEAEHLLARGGFTVEHLYGGYDKSAFGARYPESSCSWHGGSRPALLRSVLGSFLGSSFLGSLTAAAAREYPSAVPRAFNPGGPHRASLSRHAVRSRVFLPAPSGWTSLHLRHPEHAPRARRR